MTSDSTNRMFREARWRFWPGAILALTLALVAADPAFAAKNKRAKAVPSFFNSKETRSANLKPFKKWRAALARHSKEEAATKPGSCDSEKFNKCHYDEWMKFLDGIRDQGKLAQLKAVNKHMNKAKYILDKPNWGKKDYWASPGEFFTREGDCEDYAITKFMSLKHLGWNPKDLRVVAVKDMNLRIGHAVLSVFLDGKVYILDNQIKIVVEARKIRHYRPVFSINEKYWWRHRV